MSRNRRKRDAVPPVAATVPAVPTTATGRLVEIDALAALAILLCLVLGYATRNNLNPDGVSYLDLAAALRSGDWSAYVQGYWSPLYPALLAMVGAATSMEHTAFLPIVHMLNAVIACAGVMVIWRWAHVRRDRIFARVALVAFIFAAAQPLRIEAVTPDMLLLVLMAALAYELLEHGGTRWVRVGMILGVAYLAKTSVWPWLIVATVIRLVFAWRTPARAVVLQSALLASLISAPWVAAMSVDAHTFTLSSAGNLNLCWYLRECDGRTPDTHEGDHALYRPVPLANRTVISVAQLDGNGPWTYLPWSDPTTWASGVRSQRQRDTTPRELLVYWATQARYVVTTWMLPVIALVLVPMLATHWPGRRWRERTSDGRFAAVALMGIVGIAQFIAVHAEPRLIAPFTLLVALSLVTWLRHAASGSPPVGRVMWWREGATILVVLLGAGLAVRRVSSELSASALVDKRYLAIEAQLRTEHPDGARRIAVVGYAVPALSDAWRSGARIVAQIRPREAAVIGRLPPDQQVAEVRRILGSAADVAWLINPDGRFQWVTIGQ